MGTLYILQFDSGRFYIGSTTDLRRRLRQHKAGHTHSTKRIVQTFELVFSQDFESLKKARDIERKIKSWKRSDFIEKIVKDGYIKAS